MATLVPELKEGTQIKVRGRTGEIVYINRRLSLCQVMFSREYGEMVPFQEIKKTAT